MSLKSVVICSSLPINVELRRGGEVGHSSPGDSHHLFFSWKIWHKSPGMKIVSEFVPFCFVLFLLEGVKLNGTLLFCAVSDEEHSSIDGVKWVPSTPRFVLFRLRQENWFSLRCQGFKTDGSCRVVSLHTFVTRFVLDFIWKNLKEQMAFVKSMHFIITTFVCRKHCHSKRPFFFRFFFSGVDFSKYS